LSPFAFAKPLAVLFAVLVFFCAVTSTASAAGTGAIHCKGVTVSSGVLRIGGVLSDPESFKGALRVKATRKGRKPYFLPSGELVSTASVEHRIPPGKLEITNLGENALPFDPKKGKGRWRSIPVTVHDVRFEGEYEGGLELGSGGCKVEFLLAAAGGAEVSLVGTASASGPKAVKLKLVRCNYLTCGPGDFAEGLNASSSRKDSVLVQVDNASQSPAVVTGVQVALNSEVGEEVVSKEAFTPTKQSFERPAQRATTLPPISINRDKVDPGHYTGAIYLQIEGAEKRAILPFELDVKDGPLWALVVLFAALAVHGASAFAKYLRSRNSASHKVDKLTKKAKAKLGPDAVLVKSQLDRTAALVQGGQLSKAESESARIDEEIDRVEVAQGLEAAVMADQNELPDEVAQKAGAFQAAVRKGEDSKEHLKALKEEVKENVEPVPKKKSLFATSVIAFGVYVLPWIIRIVLVGAFLLAGLKELYFSNATFGAQPVADYAGLFLWGLSAAAFDIVVGKFLPGSATT
jgi:membrane protein implicated in regulation of membrane protease activity/type 1 fimbria pilin